MPGGWKMEIATAAAVAIMTLGTVTGSVSASQAHNDPNDYNPIPADPSVMFDISASRATRDGKNVVDYHIDSKGHGRWGGSGYLYKLNGTTWTLWRSSGVGTDITGQATPTMTNYAIRRGTTYRLCVWDNPYRGQEGVFRGCSPKFKG